MSRSAGYSYVSLRPVQKSPPAFLQQEVLDIARSECGAYLNFRALVARREPKLKAVSSAALKRNNDTRVKKSAHDMVVHRFIEATAAARPKTEKPITKLQVPALVTGETAESMPGESGNLANGKAYDTIALAWCGPTPVCHQLQQVPREVAAQDG